MNLRILLLQLLQIIRLVGLKYQRDRCLQASGNLAFTTLLSIVPFAIVMASISLKFESISIASTQMQQYLLEKLVPTTAESIRELLPGITQTAENITLLSLLFLLTTAVMLLRAVDKSIGTIWKRNPPTKKSFRFHYYVLVIILAPFLMGLSFSITSFLSSLAYIDMGLQRLNIEYYLLGITPVVLNAIAFTLLYKFSPQVYVSTKHARTGGIVAAIMFEAAKQVFSIYIFSFPNYQIIYGALSFIPIFLLWVYISWAIILLGAEVTYAVGRHASEDGNKTAS